MTSSSAAFFDVDRTLLDGASALRMARPLRRHGYLTHRQAARALVSQLGFAFRGADHDAMDRFAAIAKELVGGWPHSEVKELIAEELEKQITPTVFREGLDRIAMHRARGEKVYAVSATMSEVIEPLADLLGLDGAIATDMEVIDGEFTGEILRPCHGSEKAARLQEFAQANDIDLSRSSAYSDSITDEEFLHAVGRPYAVNPDKALRQLAVDEGWGILRFKTRIQAPWHRRRSTLFGFAVAAITGAVVRRKMSADR